MESDVDNKPLSGKKQISVVYCYKLLMNRKKKLIVQLNGP